MSNQPQNAFEESLLRAANDPAARPQFYRDLLDAELFIILEKPLGIEHGRQVADKPLNVSVAVHNVNGREVHHVFSSVERLQATLKSGRDYLGLRGREMIQMLGGRGWVLNPGSPFGKEFSRAELAQVLDGSIWNPAPHAVPAGRQITLGPCDLPPSELVEALKRFFSDQPGVHRAYVAMITLPDEGARPHTLVAVDASGDWPSLAASIGLIAKDVPLPNPPLDCLHLNTTPEVAQFLAAKVPPFFQR